jgi:hypothetical protein
MVQNMQNISGETDLTTCVPGDVHSEDLVPQTETLKVVSCLVCQAVYIPSSQQQGNAQSSFILLETAFLRVCHFCFRCQRPACPQCWNQTYNLCAACSKAARCVFRSPLTSFEGLIFSPPLFPQVVQMANVSFICLRNGCFYTSEPFPSETRPAEPVIPLRLSAAPSETRPAYLITSSALPMAQDTTTVSLPATDHYYPDWLQEIMGRKPDKLSGGSPQKVDDLANEPAHTEDLLSLPQTNALEPLWPSQPLPQLREQRLSTAADKSVGIETDLLEPVRTAEDLSLIERIENTLIFITSLALVLIILMVILAISSADINALFLRLIHIDIRAEIAYLLKLI